jgi:hypothetical protein
MKHIRRIASILLLVLATSFAAEPARLLELHTRSRSETAKGSGEFDLVERLCDRWDIELGPTEPRIEAEWPVPPDTPPAFAGHGGVLAVSHAAIRAFLERR